MNVNILAIGFQSELHVKGLDQHRGHNNGSPAPCSMRVRASGPCGKNPDLFLICATEPPALDKLGFVASVFLFRNFLPRPSLSPSSAKCFFILSPRGRFSQFPFCICGESGLLEAKLTFRCRGELFHAAYASLSSASCQV